MGGEDAPLSLKEGVQNYVNLINLPYKRDPKLNAKLFIEGVLSQF